MASTGSEPDLCIVGSGIAGMLCAERAVAGGRRVLMLERGRPYTHADRRRRGGHHDSLPFNRAPHSMPRGSDGSQYIFEPVYNLGGSTNHFYGNMPRMHPAHFDAGAFGGRTRRWPIRYAAIEPYYLAAERRLQICGNSVKTPFQGQFDYPLPPHASSPSDRACEAIFGTESVMQVPTVRPSKAVDARPACCGSDVCSLCPVDSKGTALNMVFPSIRERVELRSGLLAVEIHVRGRRVEAVTAIDREGAAHRIRAGHFVIASNGVDSCLLLQRSPGVPKHETLGRCYMDHTAFDVAIYGSGLDARPGYGNSAQTGMITAFFENVSPKLPVSMLGEIRFSDPVNGNVAREAVIQDVTRLAIERRYSHAASFRQRFEDIWRSTLYLRFLVETQPLMENTLSIQATLPTGQAVPLVTMRPPAYFDECMNHVIGSIRKRIPDALVKVVRRRMGEQHWMGSTRMAEDSREGSVDANLRYHGLDNLSVLSASTFPSCSSANPTMTLSALAIRLGEHLSTT